MDYSGPKIISIYLLAIMHSIGPFKKGRILETREIFGGVFNYHAYFCCSLKDSILKEHEDNLGNPGCPVSS